MTTKFELPIMPGHAHEFLRVNAAETGYEWFSITPGGSGYDTVLQGGVAAPQRSDLNFINFFLITDVASQTTVNLDTPAIADDIDFTNALVANTTFISDISTALSGEIAVVTDGTLTGNGTTGSPLSVVSGPSGANTALSNLSAVAINTALLPGVSNTIALGSTSFQWADLFLGEGGVINWDSGDVTITQTGNVLSFAGASTRYEFDANITPTTNDGAALGTTALQFSDIFLAEGGVINWDNGDVTITQTGNVLAFAGATTRYQFDGAVTPATDGGAGLGTSALQWHGLFLDGAAGGGITFDNTAAINYGLTVMLFTGASKYQFDNPVRPAADNSDSLGESGGAWSDLFLGSGAVIDFGAADVTLTHSSNALTMAGGKLILAAATTSFASLNIPAGTAPTSPVEGDIWNDSTRKTINAFIDGINMPVVTTLITTSSVSLEDYVTQLSIFLGSATGTRVLPANFFVARKVLQIRVSGRYSTAAASNDITLRMKFGSTTFNTLVIPVDNNITDGFWELEAFVICQSTGGGGTANTTIRATFYDAAGTLILTSAMNSELGTTLDTTASQTFDITAQVTGSDAAKKLQIFQTSILVFN